MLNTKKLKEYLAVVVDSAKNRYILEQTINKLDRITQTPRPNPYKEPYRPDTPIKPKIQMPAISCIFCVIFYIYGIYGIFLFVGHFINPIVNYYIILIICSKKVTIQ